MVGKVEVSRPYYLCPHCHAGQFPADVELDIENRGFSPGVRRMQAIVGQDAAFDHGRQLMKLLYVQMDSTGIPGIPVVKKETVCRPGKTEGQPSHTREVSWDASSPDQLG